MNKSNSQGSLGSVNTDSSIAKIEPQDGYFNQETPGSLDNRDIDIISDVQSVGSYASNTTGGNFNYKQKKY